MCTLLLCFPFTANPAILAAEEAVSVVQGLTVELEVYVSGFPLPTESSITWQYPDGTPVMNTDFEVQLQGGGRRLILSNVQPARAGTYQCSVVISLSPYMGASTSIQLDVYGKCTLYVNVALFVTSCIYYYLSLTKKSLLCCTCKYQDACLCHTQHAHTYIRTCTQYARCCTQ